MLEKVDELMKNPVFDAISAEQKAALIGLLTKLQNKSVPEAMPIMMQFMATMPKGRPLTQEEQNAMTEAVVSSLSPADQEKFRALLNFRKHI